MSTLVLFRNYNNYFNRIVKHDVNFSDYMGYTQEEQNLVNFNPNDGVRTEHIINWNNDWEPDYMLITDSEHNILSRWFVTDSSRTRAKQYKLKLKRDSLADNYDKVINAPMIVERAMVNSVDNPLLYNTEGFSFNQIKKEEYLLKDGTLSAWYILYFKKGLASKTITFNPKAGIEDYTISTPIDQSIFATQGSLYQTSNIVPMITYQTDGGNLGSWCYRKAIYENKSDTYEVTANDPIWFNQSLRTVKSELTIFDGTYNTLKTNVLSDEGLTNQVTQQQEQYLLWDDKLVKDSDNNLYKVHVLKNPYSVWKYKTSGDMVDTMKALINQTSLTRSGDWGDNAFAVKYDNIEYTFSYEEVTDPTGFSVDIEWATKETTKNSDYNIIAIPYNNIPFKPVQNIHLIPEDWSRALVQAIMGAYTVDSELVDVQLLPYFPIVKAQQAPVSGFAPSECTYVIDSQDSSKGICMFYVSDANFTFDIDVSLEAEGRVIERKIENETEMLRLCSPNYNGVFEFSLAKNGGVDYINVDCTLKPYNPYIHMNPNFKNLYGQDFNDAKGLICGGDFSIPIWSTAWQQYQLNNKNYLNVFDRQIQNMEFAQGQERTLAGWGIAAGTVQGGVSGAMTGFMASGSPYGAIAGGVAGSGLSLAGGLVDYSMLTERQAEQMSLSRDMFKYQLGNIKALPYSLNKVTPLTYNNKIFPFIEVYDCTDEEKDLFRNFLTYQSMTIQAVGSVGQFQQTDRTFIKGKVIRLEDLDTESHTLYDIYDELNKGVFI